MKKFIVDINSIRRVALLLVFASLILTLFPGDVTDIVSIFCFFVAGILVVWGFVLLYTQRY